LQHSNCTPAPVGKFTVIAADVISLCDWDTKHLSPATHGIASNPARVAFASAHVLPSSVSLPSVDLR
jgi:hypothetical protein